MKPWREVISPHSDVLTGTFQDAEFSADLSRVYQGTAKAEYQDPVKFYSRTYITDGMSQLLGAVIKRLSSKGGDPVIELQTKFGGGKTHTLLAVYHLASRQVPISQLAGIPSILDKIGVADIPHARFSVIDGISLNASQPQYKDDSVTINTMWGLIAWQLLGREGYDLVAASDRTGTSPGKNILIELLKKAAPCVILMDELVSYIRQFENKVDLPGGTFGTNLSFIQALTESVKAVDNAILLASLPQSEVEIGGVYGEKALKTLEKYFGRVESVWKPVDTDEGFEIVRRRLFDAVHDEEAMNDVCNEFMKLYSKNKDAFPPEALSDAYLERLKKSYPIHPEIFDRFYNDWSTLEKFQATRGILQYMATVIYELWSSGNTDALIMPGSIPQSKLSNQNSKYLEKNWNSIVDQEIDGERSLPMRLDKKETRFGSVQACQRVTRTIFLGTAPDDALEVKGSRRTTRGLTKKQILLGCVAPNQTLSVYVDALDKLRDQLHYLFTNDTQRYWFATRPNLRREMESRKEKVDDVTLSDKLSSVSRDVFSSDSRLKVYIFPQSDEVPEWDSDNGLQLVVLPPDLHTAYDGKISTALSDAARNILDNRGTAKRNKRNRIVFLVPSSSGVKQLNDQCKTLLAWEDIKKDDEALRINLDSYQKNEVKDELAQARHRLKSDLASCYATVLVPKEGNRNQLEFTPRAIKSALGEPVVSRVASRLISEEDVIDRWNPNSLYELVKELYFDQGKAFIPVKTLWEDMSKYLYCPRLMSLNVLSEAIIAGVKQRFFGIASSESRGHYESFLFGNAPLFINPGASILLSPAEALRVEQESKPTVSPTPTPAPEPGPRRPQPGSPTTGNDSHKEQFKRFYATAELDPDASSRERYKSIIEEVVTHLANCSGARVKLTLTIEADADIPFDDHTVRTVKENCSNLNIEGEGFFND